MTSGILLVMLVVFGIIYPRVCYIFLIVFLLLLLHIYLFIKFHENKSIFAIYIF